MVYVGKTQNQVMDRFISLRADLRREDNTKPAYHFKQEGHKSEDMEVVIIDEVEGKDNMYRVTRERYWINCLGSPKLGLTNMNLVFFLEKCTQGNVMRKCSLNLGCTRFGPQI